MDKLARVVLKSNSDVNLPQFLAILCVYENPGQSQKFIADWLQLTEATVSYMVNKLSETDYLKFEKNSNDNKSRKVYVTKRGTGLVKKIYPLLEKTIEPHISIINDDKLFEMLKNIDAIKESIDKSNQGSC
jgi:MarR family transcriptional regulator for hemolysin